ncbi:DivIVA domain-containing protein [Halonatronum saccharophilum]|uniref:DivIVA domain-containing protein n=1 Tax=Halonatronum saccharophilum TaxID=150060 RepID=UPI000480EAD8|nr:DivIVA domain-containing protein [Halonatronum saccharophilum]
MSLRPDDIYNKEFKKKLTGGYDSKEVDDFLDLIATYYEELFSKNIDLKAEVEDLDKQLQHYKNEEGNLHQTLKKVHKVFESTSDKAKEEADKILEEARVERDELISKAQIKADNLLEEAEKEAHKILKDANDKIVDKEEYYKDLLEKERLFKHRISSFLEEGIDTLGGMLKKVNIELEKDGEKQEEE